MALALIALSALLPYRCCGMSPSLFEAVKRLPSIGATPLLYPTAGDVAVVVSDDVVFKSDVMTARGIAEYRKVYDSFGSAREELCDLQFNATSFFIGPNTISVSWNASFIPFAVQGVYYFCKLLGKEICFFDILAREREVSAFSWSKLRAFVGSLFFSGRVRLLRAVVLGTTEYYYDLVDTASSSSSGGSSSDDRRLVIKSAVEKIGLLKRLDDGVVKNRAIVSHLAEFLDSRKVADVDAVVWGTVVTDRVRSRAVPGSGQFDIDGLSDESRQELLATSNQALFFANLLVLSVGVVLSFSLLYKLYFGIDSNSYYKGYSGRNVPKDFFSGDQRDGQINRNYLDEDF